MSGDPGGNATLVIHIIQATSSYGLNTTLLLIFRKLIFMLFYVTLKISEITFNLISQCAFFWISFISADTELPWANTSPDFMQSMTQYSVYYAYLGAVVFVASFIQVKVFGNILCGLCFNCNFRFWDVAALYVEAVPMFLCKYMHTHTQIYIYIYIYANIHTN
jgi:hypothetical protein